MPLPLLAAAGIGAAGSLLSSFIGNRGAARQQRLANEHNVNFWNMQNEYNHPSAQMARLREAGLNPNMIYGTSPSSAVGNAERVAPAKAADYRMDNPVAGMAMYADFQQRNAQTDNLRTQNTVLQQETVLKGLQSAKVAAETARSKFDLGLAKELRDSSLEAAKANVRQIEANTINKELDNSFKHQTMKDMVKDAFYRARNAEENLKGNQLLNELRALERDLKKIGIERNDPWYFRILGRNWENLKGIIKD